MTNIKKCVGCGSIMQSLDETKLGYVRESKFESSEYCEKCFKMKHYGNISMLSRLSYLVFTSFHCSYSLGYCLENNRNVEICTQQSSDLVYLYYSI